MVRDVSYAVRVPDEPTIVAALVLDVDTGLARGVSMAGTARAAYSQAMGAALANPAGPQPPALPARVVCSGVPAADVREELARLLDTDPPAVDDGVAGTEAEDIFDSMVGHMSGRRQPRDSPTPADWRMLYDHAAGYLEAEPWRHRSDAEHLGLVVDVDGAAARYVAVVMGQENIQHGLALYPGAALPSDLYDWEPGSPAPMPAGTLLLWLDPPTEVRPEFAAKALRYGWPPEADLLPTALAAGPDGAADLDRRATHHLTLAIAAVLAHHDPERAPGNGTGTLTGELPLPDNIRGSYTISQS